MKEIHAYQNDDGSYMIEVFGTQTLENGEPAEYKMEIPNGKISITALQPYDDEEKYFSIIVEQENNYE